MLCLTICAVFALLAVFTQTQSVINADAAMSNSEIQSEIDSLNNKMDKISKERDNLKKLINSAKSEANSLSNELTDITYEVDLLDEQIIVMTTLLEQYTSLTAQQEIEIADLEAKIEKEQKMLDSMIRMSYEYGGTGNSLEFIFSAEDFSDLIMRMDLISYHLSYNDKVIESYGNTLASIEKTKAEYENAITVMTEYKTQQETLKE
jgi:peptidoglycan hydrolase CwlO-like protein